MNEPLARLTDASCAIGGRTLWSHVDLEVGPGEFIAVLGPNGAGKTTMLRTLLGLAPLTGGRATITRGVRTGYVPQMRDNAFTVPIRGRDLVRFGLDGGRWGPLGAGRTARGLVDRALAEVGATAYADAPVSVLSGGEQQRLRIAQALVGDPSLLLCDEPLSSLDVANQTAICEILGRRMRERRTGVLFVSHEVNTILPLVDRVVYIARGRARIGTVDEVMRSDVLSELYGMPIDVLRHKGSIVVLAEADDGMHHDPDHLLSEDR